MPMVLLRRLAQVAVCERERQVELRARLVGQRAADEAGTLRPLVLGGQRMELLGLLDADARRAGWPAARGRPGGRCPLLALLPATLSLELFAARRCWSPDRPHPPTLAPSPLSAWSGGSRTVSWTCPYPRACGTPCAGGAGYPRDADRSSSRAVPVWRPLVQGKIKRLPRACRQGGPRTRQRVATPSARRVPNAVLGGRPGVLGQGLSLRDSLKEGTRPLRPLRAARCPSGG